MSQQPTEDSELSQEIRPGLSPASIIALAAVGAALVWAYWPTLVLIATEWRTDPQYSHGYLVPVFAGVLLWLRRRTVNPLPLQPSLWGLPFLLAALGMWLVAGICYFTSLEAVSLVPCVGGLCLLLGGWPALRWAWPAIGFLVFMIPLPFGLKTAFVHHLRHVATVASTYVLQTVGYPAVAEGNIIYLDDARIGVAEACSGLSMLVVFIALATAVALIVERKLWEKLVIIASAVPIALIANIVRITATGTLLDSAGEGTLFTLFHEVVGWLMIAFALVLLSIELAILSRLFVEREPRRAVPLDLSGARWPRSTRGGA